MRPVELRGKWRLSEPGVHAKVCGERDEVTVLEFSCANGVTIEVMLEKLP